MDVRKSTWVKASPDLLPPVNVHRSKGEILKIRVQHAALFFISIIASPIPAWSKRAEFSLLHAEFKVQEAKHRAQFGSDLIGTTRNIKKQNEGSVKEEKKLAARLFKRCEEILKSNDWKHLQLQRSKKIKPLSVNGICLGMSITTGNMLLSGWKIDELADNVRKGASIEAAALQHVENALKSSDITMKRRLLEQFLDGLSVIVESGHGEKLNEASPKAAELALCNVNQAFKGSFGFRSENNKKELSSIDKDFVQLINRNMNAVKECMNGNTIDFKRLQQSLQNKIDDNFKKSLQSSSENISKHIQTRQKHTNTLKLMVSIGEMVQGGGQMESAISDPTHKELITKMRAQEERLDKLRVLGELGGVRFSSVNQAMGIAVLAKNDQTYLEGLKHLETGVYTVVISTHRGGHALTYKLNEDGTAHIIDPNGPILFCKDIQHSKELLERVISGYSEPQNKTIFSGSNDSHHNICIYRMELDD